VRKRVRPGEALARLRIGRIGLDAIVVEGVSRVALRQGPGRLPTTGFPGENRNCAIAAHRDGWFRRLPDVRAGDPVWVETPGRRYEYVVEEKRVVTPDRGDLLRRGPNPVLTLITCTGPGYPRSTHRLLVFCRLRTVQQKGNEAPQG
jgi:sortase A